MSVPESSWAAYQGAGFAVSVPFAGRWQVVPAPPGVVEGPFLPERPAVFVTAHNPRGRILDHADNAARHAELVALVDDAGWTWWPAVGGVAGVHLEDGVLLVDATEADGMRVGRWFDQDAVYVWRADGVALVACDGTRSDVVGWRCTAMPEGWDGAGGWDGADGGDGPQGAPGS